MTTPQPRTKVSQVLIVHPQECPQTFKKVAISPLTFCPHLQIYPQLHTGTEKEAGIGMGQASLSLKCWPSWSGCSFVTFFQMPVMVALCHRLAALWSLLWLPSCSLCPVSGKPRGFLVWLNVFNKEHFPVHQGEISLGSVS